MYYKVLKCIIIHFNKDDKNIINSKKAIVKIKIL